MIDSWTGADLARITTGTWDKVPPNSAFCNIEIDHRKLGKTGIFVALAGTSHNGHDFVQALSASQCAIVETIQENATAPQLQVGHPLNALEELARAAMAQTTAKKIAITGSVGKTGTRAALSYLLNAYGICHATKGNLNNHIGFTFGASFHYEGLFHFLVMLK